MPPGVSGPLVIATGCPRASDARNCPLVSCYTPLKQVTGYLLSFPGNRGSHTPWACDPPHPAVPYALDHENDTSQAQHGYQGLLKTRWSQTWTLWCIPPAGGGGFPCPQSLARCQGAGGGHLSPRTLGYLGSIFGLTEWRAVGVPVLCRQHC